jgi:hypothetical protein
MAEVACFAATIPSEPDVTMTSTLSLTNSAAISAKRSTLHLQFLKNKRPVSVRN